ncbi:MAG: hypothetical protein IJ880_02735, partial [Bacilli bacterium]|nr:hypothetical protein [Bacilli bacterium]
MNDNNLNNQNNIQEPTNQVPVDNIQQNVEQPQPVENLEQITPQPVENIQPNVVQEPQPAPVPEPMPSTEPPAPTNNVIDNQPNVTQPLDNQANFGQQMNSVQPQPMNNQPNKSNKGLKIVLVIFGLIIVGLIVFMITNNGGSKTGSSNQTISASDANEYKENQITDDPDEPEYVVQYKIPKDFKASGYNSRSNKDYSLTKDSFSKSAKIEIEWDVDTEENSSNQCKSYLENDKE